jgi:hypothetical protein
MFEFKDKGLRLVTISFFVYLLVNSFENLIHYNIGRFSDNETKIELPSKKDWTKMVVVIITFAMIQGLLTFFFNKHLKPKKG